jgi:hypothetical protein
MENTRLLQLLRTFSDAELRALKKFVRSPYFNQRREVTDLLDFLEKPLKNKRPAPEKERAFAAVFGKDQFDDHRIRMAMSFLFQLASQFLSVQDFVGDTSQLRLRQAGLLRQRKLQGHAQQTLMESATALMNRSQRNADFHQQHYQFLLETRQGLCLCRSFPTNWTGPF